MNFTPWKARGCAVASGLLLAGAFPPLNWWPLVFVALVPLLLVVWMVPVKGHAFGRAFRLGWQFGFVFFTATLWWIQHVTLPGMLALTAYLALYPAVAMGVAGWLGVWPHKSRWTAAGKLALVAGVWTGLEWVRSVALSGFPWNSIGVPLFDLHSARMLAESIGVIGLSGIFLVFPLVLAAIIRLRGRKSGAGLFRWTAGWILAELLVRFAVGRGPGPELTHHKVALLQPNVTMQEKMSVDPEVQRQRYFDLVAQTDAALASQDADGISLVVWPESAVPGFFNEMVEGGAFSEQLKQGDFSLVTGADHEEWGKLYNSVAVMRGTTENRAIHPKVRLVPFGEFIPFRKAVPLFEKMLGGLIPLDFAAGTQLDPLRVKAQPFSIVPLVCFEDTMGNHARKFVRPEPQVLVNVTNDNWFHQSPATEMHFANARWRAVELGRTLVRSANTGVTAIVSPEGGVQRLPSFQTGTLTGWFHTGDSRMTFYARRGDLFSQAAGALALLGCLAIWWTRRKGKSGN